MDYQTGDFNRDEVYYKRSAEKCLKFAKSLIYETPFNDYFEYWW